MPERGDHDELGEDADAEETHHVELGEDADAKRTHHVELGEEADATGTHQDELGEDADAKAKPTTPQAMCIFNKCDSHIRDIQAKIQPASASGEAPSDGKMNSSTHMQALLTTPYSDKKYNNTIRKHVPEIMKMHGYVCKDNRTLAMRDKLKRKIEMRNKQKEAGN